MLPLARDEELAHDAVLRRSGDDARTPLDAIVVLGCRVQVDSAGRLFPGGALARRLDAAARVYALRGHAATIVLVSGGRRWGPIVEADAMARELPSRGVPARAIVRERCSMSTAENARYALELLARLGIDLARSAVVTCEWHLPRARALFERAGVRLEGIGAGSGAAPWRRRLWWWGRERVLSFWIRG